jgi:hypothetical protein
MRYADLSRKGPMTRKRREIPEKQPQPPADQRVFPMQLKVSDRIVDETGEYEGDRPTLYDGLQQETRYTA